VSSQGHELIVILGIIAQTGDHQGVFIGMIFSCLQRPLAEYRRVGYVQISFNDLKDVFPEDSRLRDLARKESKVNRSSNISRFSFILHRSNMVSSRVKERSVFFFYPQEHL